MALMIQAPARRLAYHLDGSQVSYFANTNTATVATQTNLNYLNDEEFTNDYIDIGNGVSNLTIGILFPEKRNICNYFLFITGSSSSYPVNTLTISVSTDTTNGLNGTWTTLTTPTPNGLLNIGSSSSYGLNNMEWFDDTKVSGSLTGATDIKGIKFYATFSGINYSSTGYQYIKTLNLWGNINDPSATQRVAFTDNSGVALTRDNPPYTVKRGDTNIQSLYLKNLHSTATSKIDFAIDGEITSVNNAVTISVDGGTTYNTLPYSWTTNLASGAVSLEIKVKYVVPASETYGYKYFGINAKPTFV